MEQQETAKHSSQKEKFHWLKTIRPYLKLVVAVFFVWLLVRSFCCQVMYIPSPSMNGTLYEGDYILVNKLAYGPRLPITLFSLPFSEDTYLDWVEFSYHRIPGYSSVQRNDVIVFNFPSENEVPIDIRQPFIKRCVALPGDQLQLINGEVFVNGKKLEAPNDLQLRYAVTMKANAHADSLFKQIAISKPYISIDKIHYQLLLTKKLSQTLLATGKVDSIEPSLSTAENGLGLFPHNASCKWSLDNYGPLLVPHKGDQVQLTAENLPIYKRIIEIYEGNKLLVKNDSVFINGKYASSYTFQQDYYFTLGDNRYDSEDSRYWGFVPESHLIGKASYVVSGVGKGRSFVGIR